MDRIHSLARMNLRTLRAAAAEQVQVQVVTPRVGEVVEVGRPFSNVEWYVPAR